MVLEPRGGAHAGRLVRDLLRRGRQANEDKHHGHEASSTGSCPGVMRLRLCWRAWASQRAGGQGALSGVPVDRGRSAGVN